MNLKHSAITSPIFELVKIIEFDINLGNSWTTRIELFRQIGNNNRFRCNVWAVEPYRLTPSFPRDDDNQPSETTDDLIMVKWHFPHSTIDYADFEAADQDEALDKIINDIKYFLEYVTGEEAEKK